MPLIAYMEMNAFKIYMLDVGLLAAKGNLDARTLLEGNRMGVRTFFWTRNL